jgi:hypothetical protein
MIWGWLVTRVISPFLPWILGGLIALGTAGTMTAYFKGRADANANCREADLRAELATLKRDLAAWRAADEVENMLQRDLEAERKQLQERVSEYELELANRPDSRCVLDQRDVDRLRFDRKR